MTEIICMASSKGGSGKTTITAALGTFLARSGRKVLLIDCDEGTHGLTLMYLDEVNSHRKRAEFTPRGTFDITSGSDLNRLGASAVQIEKNLSLFPARQIFNDAEVVPVGKDFRRILHLIIRHFLLEYDFIFLDAQAGISLASKAAMSPENSDLVVLASEYDPMSNAGIERLKARLPDELDISRTWILLNKLLPEFVSKFSEFLSVARYLPPIPWTADVVRAYSRRQLALDFENGNQFTLAVLSVLRELLDRTDRELLEEWVESQTQRLREPVEEQIEETETLLANMRKIAYEVSATNKKFSDHAISMLTTVFSLLVSLLGIFVGFSYFTQGPFYSDHLTYNSDISLAFSAAGLIAFLGLLMLAWRTSVMERRERSQRIIAERFGEVSDVQRRLDELKSLRNAGFEELVKKRTKK